MLYASAKIPLTIPKYHFQLTVLEEGSSISHKTIEMIPRKGAAFLVLLQRKHSVYNSMEVNEYLTPSITQSSLKRTSDASVT